MGVTGLLFEKLENVYKNTKIDLTITLYFLCLLQVITGFSNSYVNLVFVAVLYLALITLPFKEAFKLLPVIIVYFGYTYVNMSLPGGIIFGNRYVSNFFIAILSIKALISYSRSILSKRYLVFILLMLFLICQRFYYGEYFKIIWLICSMVAGLSYIAVIKRDRKCLAAFIDVFVFILATVYIYNLLHLGKYETPSAEGFRGLQFAGMRDGNNFSLQANLCLALIFAANLHKTKKYRWFIGFLVISSVVTISLSGIFTTLCILFLAAMRYVIKDKRLLAIILCLFILLIMASPFVIDILARSNIKVITGIVERINLSKEYLIAGDFNKLTSYRTYLWGVYMDEYNALSPMQQLTGNAKVVQQVLDKGTLASHNAWIDFLITNGILGTSLFLIQLVINMYINWRRNEAFNNYLTAVFILNVFMRSIDGLMLYILLF